MDDNLGTGSGYLSGTRPDRDEYGYDFLPAGTIRIRLEMKRVQNRYFFSPIGDPLGTRI
jgi:hypothetical protein